MLCPSAEKANSSTFIPGKPDFLTISNTLGVKKPRSSAMISSLPSFLSMASKSSSPGPFSQWPPAAVSSSAGIA